MSTPSITPISLPTFVLGEQASASTYLEALQSLVNQGTLTLSELGNTNTTTLIDLNRRMSAIDAHRQRANRLGTYGIYANFSVGDMFSVDQTQSSATVRIDSQSSTLKQRPNFVTASVASTVFSSNIGTVQTLDDTNTLWTVTTSGAIPTGSFSITLDNPVNLNVIVVDISAISSTPVMTASASSDGVNYTQATSIDLSGYTVSAWFPSMDVKYFTLQITPVMADTPNGYSFTFGLTNFNATGIEYSLQSFLMMNSLTFIPESSQAMLITDTTPRISYYLSLTPEGSAQAPFVEVTPNTPIPLPGTSVISIQNVSDVSLEYSTFLNGLSLTPGQFVVPTIPNGFAYQAPYGGVLQATGEPRWPTTPGLMIVSGTAELISYPNGTFMSRTLYPLGMIVRPSVDNGFVYQVTSAGTTGSEEPSWPTTIGATVSSFGEGRPAIFTCEYAGILCTELPLNTYLNTVHVVSDATGETIDLAPGLVPSYGAQQNLLGTYIGLVEGSSGWQPYIISSNPFANFGSSYTITYTCGPATITAALQVKFDTEDIASSPVFYGATLQEY